MLIHDAARPFVEPALIARVIETGKGPKALVEAEGLAQISGDEAIRALARQVIAENPGQVTAYRAKPTLLKWFVGQVMLGAFVSLTTVKTAVVSSPERSCGAMRGSMRTGALVETRVSPTPALPPAAMASA